MSFIASSSYSRNVSKEANEMKVNDVRLLLGNINENAKRLLADEEWLGEDDLYTFKIILIDQIEIRKRMLLDVLVQQQQQQQQEQQEQQRLHINKVEAYKLGQLCEMGFDETLAYKLLICTNNDIELALQLNELESHKANKVMDLKSISSAEEWQIASLKKKKKLTNRKSKMGSSESSELLSVKNDTNNFVNLPDMDMTSPASISLSSTSTSASSDEIIIKSTSFHHDFECPISFELMIDPVVCADGETYERHHIEKWLSNRDTSPITGEKLSHKFLNPNKALRILIREFKDKNNVKI